MGNCLITKLKSAVDNSNLRPLGSLVMYADKLSLPVSQRGLSVNSTSTEYEVIVIGDGFVGTSDSDINYKRITLSGNATLYFSDGKFSIYITNRDAITALTNLTDSQNSIYTLCENLKYQFNLGVISLRTGGLKGALSDLSGLTNLTNLWIRENEIYGNIESLVGLRKLGRLQVNGCPVDGAVEVLAQGMASGGRTDGSLIVDPNGRLTYNGNVIVSSVTVNFGSYMVDPTAEDTARGWQVV